MPVKFDATESLSSQGNGTMKTDKAGCSRREPMLPGHTGRSAGLAAEIKATYVRGVTTQADLAARFGVSQQLISKIVRSRS
jgi:hypothetical protein